MVEIVLSSAALGPVVGVLPDGRDLAVRFTHELLQSLLKQLIRSFGRGRRGGSGADRPILGRRAILPTGSTTAEIAAALSGGILTLGLGLQTLDGQIDLATIQADDHDFHILTFGQILVMRRC